MNVGSHQSVSLTRDRRYVPGPQAHMEIEAPAALNSAINGLSESPLFADSESLHSLSLSVRQCDDNFSAADVNCTAALKQFQSMSDGGSKTSDEVSKLVEDDSQAPKNAQQGLPGPPRVAPSHVVEDLATTTVSPATSTPTSEGSKRSLRFECPTCQRSFARRAVLVNHERTHTGEKPFSCDFQGCSQSFAQQGDKTRHEQTQHTEKTFICGSSQDEGPSWGCGKRFRRKDGLLEHHSKTKKGKQCVADRDKVMGLERGGDEDSLTFP